LTVRLFTYDPHIETAPAQRAILITGASTGIGRACTVHLAGRHWRVFAGVRNDSDAETLRSAHDHITPIMLDVTNEQHIERAAQTIADRVGDAGLHALFNNAGIGLGGPVEFLPMHIWKRQYDINVFGQLAVTRAMLPLLRRAAPPARIVMMSSISGRVSSPLLGPYASSKFAIEAISDALRLELRPWNLRVAVIEPGPIDTPIWRKAQDTIDELQKELPAEAFERYGDMMNALLESARRSERNAAPVSAVVGAIEHALNAKRPRARYLIGRDARIGALLAGLLPTRWRDALMARELGIAPKPG